MHVITKSRIVDAQAKHNDSSGALSAWYQLIKANEFENYAEIMKVFPSIDKVKNLYVFNVGGNKLRVICAIHFNRRKVFIRYVLTHKEYDQNRWKQQEGI